MTKKEAKIKALRIATAILYGGLTQWYDESLLPEEEEEKVKKELEELAVAMHKRALKMGGDFIETTGYPVDQKEIKNKINDV